MKNNDISGSTVPHDVIVWEGLLGVLPDEKAVKAVERLLDRGRWDKALALYELNEMMARKIVHLAYHGAIEFDVITYLGEGFGKALEKRLDKEGLPIREVLYGEDPYQFARNLIMRPDLRTIYDGDQFRRFVYGQRGRVISPDQHNMLGGL